MTESEAQDSDSEAQASDSQGEEDDSNRIEHLHGRFWADFTHSSMGIVWSHVIFFCVS